MATAFFPGSFNPFTIGHLSIVERASAIFEHIVVAVGINLTKSSESEADIIVEDIRKSVSHLKNVSVVSYDGLTVSACRKYGATVIIRGLRNSSDFNYEQQLAEVNRQISGIDTVFFNSVPELAHISSSMVRELLHYGIDVSKFIPKKQNLI